MARLTHEGKVSVLRIHRVRGFGPPPNHISVHVVVKLHSQPARFMGFPLADGPELFVEEAWVDMLRDAFNHNHTVRVESEFDTEAGTNGVIRTITLVKGAPFNTGELADENDD